MPCEHAKFINKIITGYMKNSNNIEIRSIKNKK